MTRLLYALRNWRAWWRAWALGRVQTKGATCYVGELRAVVRRADGRERDLGVLSRRIVTNAALTFIRDDFNDGASDINLFNFHDSGTGTVAENATDTALGTPAGPARVAGTKSVPSAFVFRTVATIAYTATLAITEHGVFSASTAGTLLDRSVFAAINVINGDSVQFTYSLTLSGT